jgi:hypothetical protein
MTWVCQIPKTTRFLFAMPETTLHGTQGGDYEL